MSVYKIIINLYLVIIIIFMQDIEIVWMMPLFHSQPALVDRSIVASLGLAPNTAWPGGSTLSDLWHHASFAYLHWLVAAIHSLLLCCIGGILKSFFICGPPRWLLEQSERPSVVRGFRVKPHKDDVDSGPGIAPYFFGRVSSILESPPLKNPALKLGDIHKRMEVGDINFKDYIRQKYPRRYIASKQRFF